MVFLAAQESPMGGCHEDFSAARCFSRVRASVRRHFGPQPATASCKTKSATCPGAAGIRSPQSEDSQSKEPQPSDETPEQKQRRLIVARVSAIADRILALPDERLQANQKARVLGTLAGQLCRYYTDEASKIFFRLSAMLRQQAASAATNSKSGISYDRRLLLRHAAACGAILAGQLGQELPQIGGTPKVPLSLARAMIPVYLEVVSPLESIVEDLKRLPPAKLEVAADFVHRLKRISEEERQATLTRTAGSLSREDADAMEKAIEEGCEQIKEQGW